MIRFCSHYLSLIDLSVKSAEVIVMTAFQQHRIKDVSRAQLVGAVKSLSSPDVRRKYRVADKASLVPPVARALLVRGIVSISPSAAIDNLVPTDVKKVETF